MSSSEAVRNVHWKLRWKKEEGGSPRGGDERRCGGGLACTGLERPILFAPSAVIRSDYILLFKYTLRYGTTRNRNIQNDSKLYGNTLGVNLELSNKITVTVFRKGHNVHDDVSI